MPVEHPKYGISVANIQLRYGRILHSSSPAYHTLKLTLHLTPGEPQLELLILGLIDGLLQIGLSQVGSHIVNYIM